MALVTICGEVVFPISGSQVRTVSREPLLSGNWGWASWRHPGRSPSVSLRRLLTHHHLWNNAEDARPL